MHDITNSEISEIQTWSLYNDKIIKFVNNANYIVFNNLFKEDSERLLEYFIVVCKRDFNTFLTYLTTEQKNELLIHIVKIKL